MTEIIAFYTHPLPGGQEHRHRLLQEIAFLETRALDLHDGDCAYERALGRTYSALLGLRRQELIHLDG